MCAPADSWAATHVILILPTRPTLSLHGGVEKCFVILISFTPQKKSFPKQKPGGSMGWVGIRMPFLQGTRLLTLVNMPKLEEKNISSYYVNETSTTLYIRGKMYLSYKRTRVAIWSCMWSFGFTRNKQRFFEAAKLASAWYPSWAGEMLGS